MNIQVSILGQRRDGRTGWLQSIIAVSGCCLHQYSNTMQKDTVASLHSHPILIVSMSISMTT